MGDLMPAKPKSKYMVRRAGKTTIVEAIGNARLLGIPGVFCVNPDAPPRKRIYRRIFKNPKKRIYLPHEYDLAVRKELGGRHPFVVGMNGYSHLSEAQCAAWGVKPSAYRSGCAVFLEQIDKCLRKNFPAANVCYVHGASDMEVDKAVSETATRLRRQQLGFSCPEYLFYVPDNAAPVYVAKTAEEYSDAFVRTGDVLIAANGRLQAFRMDIAAVFLHDKFLLPVNILKLISSTGGPPARGANGEIEDAVAHFEQRFFAIGAQVFGLKGRDTWAAAIGEAKDIMKHICRHVLAPEVALRIVDDVRLAA